MTRVVSATFPHAEAARRAAVALGRAELAAGPTRVRLDAAAPERGALLELRVDEPDARRAIALMREHGATVTDRDDSRETPGGAALAAWGMAVADAVTAAMSGATASDAQVPARIRTEDAGPTLAGHEPDAPAPGEEGVRHARPPERDPRRRGTRPGSDT
jgi:hypothetical protein